MRLGVAAAIDHSCFYVPGSWIDGRYHWDHHLLNTWNYSEMELLDRLFGTLKVWDGMPYYLKSPRLQQQIKATAVFKGVLECH